MTTEFHSIQFFAQIKISVFQNLKEVFSFPLPEKKIQLYQIIYATILEQN